jgi:hypothetical protein
MGEKCHAQASGIQAGWQRVLASNLDAQHAHGLSSCYACTFTPAPLVLRLACDRQIDNSNLAIRLPLESRRVGS